MTLEDTIRTLKDDSNPEFLPCDDAVIAMAITIRKLGEEQGVSAYSLQGSVESSVVITYLGVGKRYVLIEVFPNTEVCYLWSKCDGNLPDARDADLSTLSKDAFWKAVQGFLDGIREDVSGV